MKQRTRRQQRISTGPLAVVGYVRVSTDEQAACGLGLEAQRAKIHEECERQGWHLVATHEDQGVSGKAMSNRPALTAALAAIDCGDADGLVVAKLDRLSRSLTDAASIIARAGAEGWRLVTIDLQLDTGTPAGKAMAHVMAIFAQFERDMIAQRTKEALAVRKAQGVRLGRPRSIPEEVVARIVQLRAQGATQTAIAEHLNAEGVPTAGRAPRWQQSTVRDVLRSVALDADYQAARAGGTAA